MKNKTTTIKLSTEETVLNLFEALSFRTETDQKKVREAINLFLNMAHCKHHPIWENPI